MGKPILYGAELSPAVRGVWLTARAMNLELDNRTISLLAGEHLKPEYLKINPQHTVPTLDDNGLIVWDSHAICTYLIDKYGKNDHLYPKDIGVRAKINQRLYFDVGVAFASFRPVVQAVFFKGATEFPAEAVKEIHAAYNFLELFLKDDQYMVGNTITVADYCLVATISTGQLAVPILEDSYPKLAAWFGRMKSVPFYQETNGRFVEKFGQFIAAKLEANRKVVATSATVAETESATVAAESVTIATESATVATESATVATESATIATESATVATESATVATESATVATESATVATERAIVSNESATDETSVADAASVAEATSTTDATTNEN